MFVLCVLIIANISIYQVLLAPHVLHVHVFEIGKGRAALVRGPHGETILVDAGPDAGILRELGMVLPPWQRQIDAVILTSMKSAFAGGLPDVERRYRITQRLSSGSRFSSNGVFIDIVSAGTFTIAYGSTAFSVSSTTPAGEYVSDGDVLQKKKAGAP
jgi:beta-lactamase superfamily II metal-dependent hydrolase